MNLAEHRFSQLLDSSYFQQAAGASYMVLVMVLVSMVATGCLLRAVAKDHVRETILSDLHDLDIHGRPSQEVLRNIESLVSQGGVLGRNGLVVVRGSQPRETNDVFSGNGDHYLGIEIKVNANEVYFIGYDVRPMLARVQVVPLIAGLILFLVLVAGLIINLRSTRYNLSRIDAVVENMRNFAIGEPQVWGGVSTKNDEIDRLGEEVQKNLGLIERLLSEVANLSHHLAHELRTPLTRLQNRLVDIIDGAGDASASDVQGLLQESERIQNLFSALMRLGEVETNRCYFLEKPLDVTLLLSDLASYYEPMVEGQSCCLSILSDENLVIHADEALVFQALSNLLENAFKYAKGCSEINIFAKQNQSEVWVGVADTGKGIPETLREKATQRFSRLESHLDGVEGFGLGLSLVKAIVERHGGLLVLSDNNPGLRACLKFPKKV